MENYYVSEVLYPDYCTYPNVQSDLQAPYTVYNLNQYAQVENNRENFYVYEPQQNPGGYGSYGYGYDSGIDNGIEDILRRNSEVWDAYQTGKYDVSEEPGSSRRKIILKERSRRGEKVDYKIKKYRVTLTGRRQGGRGGGNSNDHVMLVSFTSSAANVNCVQEVVQEVVEERYEHYDQREESQADISVEYYESSRRRKSKSDFSQSEQYVTGPGSDLINDMVDDYEEESEREITPGPESSCYTSCADSAGRYPSVEIESEPAKRIEMEGVEDDYDEEPLEEAVQDSFDDDYANEFAPRKTYDSRVSSRLSGSVRKVLDELDRSSKAEHRSVGTIGSTVSLQQSTTSNRTPAGTPASYNAFAFSEQQASVSGTPDFSAGASTPTSSRSKTSGSRVFAGENSFGSRSSHRKNKSSSRSKLTQRNQQRAQIPSPFRLHSKSIESK